MADITGHTPGPWTIDHERIGPLGEPVALLCDSHASASGTVIDLPRMTHEAVDDDENEANARLIATATDLFDSVLELLDIAQGNHSDCDWGSDTNCRAEQYGDGRADDHSYLRKAEAAIANANGLMGRITPEERKRGD